MSTLTWRPDFDLAQPRMDATHREFVQQLADLERLATGRPSAAGAALQALLDHTIAHFAQEERWMASLGFGPDNCHQLQHANVLELVREVRRRLAAEGDALDPELLPQLVQALAQWFPTHALMMDAALAETMAERGFDPDADMARPPATATTPARGCGGSG
jgi:hemerythrin-like metal-binding protein